MGHVFISYSRNDSPAARKLATTLRAAGYEPWIDEEIPGGDLWRRQIVEAIGKAEVVILLLSPRSVESREVRKELDLADGKKIPILPVEIEPVAVPPEMEYQIAGVQKIHLGAGSGSGEKPLLDAIRFLCGLKKEMKSADWIDIMDSKESHETLISIWADPKLSVREKIRLFAQRSTDLSERKKRCGERLVNVTSRYNTIRNERDTLSEQRNALMAEQLKGIHTTRQQEVSGKIKEIDRQSELIEREMNELRKQEMSLLKERFGMRDAR